MEILKVNYEVGKKCFIRFNNEYHECIFMGTRSVQNERGYWVACYVLNIAGFGVRNVEFDRMGQFDNWYHRTTCHTILYRTLDDCRNYKNPITAQYGDDGNCYNSSFMQQFFDDCSVCNCGGSIYTYIWDGTDAVLCFGYWDSGEWRIDENGFHTTARLHNFGEKGQYTTLRVFHGYRKYYGTKQACLADNEPNVVTFD